MKYLRTYSLFKETLEVKDTDQPDEKEAKESLNKTEEYLNQYKQLKPKIEQIYNVTKNPIEVQTELDKILPKDKDGENPFIAQLLKINRLQKEILDGRQSELENEKKMSEYNDELKGVDSADSKSRISSWIKDVKDKISISKSEIAKKSKELQKTIKEHDLKMNQIEKDLKEESAKIKIKV